MLELSFIGIIVGVLSGFFGIGGGSVLVPLLLLLGYEIKGAIGISVIQMTFSSLYGSYLNNKRGSLDISMVLFIGIGGFSGALFSGVLTSTFNTRTLEFIFLSFSVFAVIRLFFKTQEHQEQKEVHKLLLVFIGFILGALSMTIGVGGSIILIPILVSFFHVPLKKAVSAGLFFVVFSSVSGLIAHTMEENIDYESGIIIGMASLVGVYAGIHLKDTVGVKLQKNLLVIFYMLVVAYLIQRIFI